MIFWCCLCTKEVTNRYICVECFFDFSSIRPDYKTGKISFEPIGDIDNGLELEYIHLVRKHLDEIKKITLRMLEEE